MDVKHFGMRLCQLGANTTRIYESFPVAIRWVHKSNELRASPLQRKQGTSECGNPSKFNILDQHQTDPDIWPECVCH